MQALEKHRLQAGLDVFVVPEFAQKYLGFDPAQLQQAMEANYPVRGAGDTIEWARPQWVEGDNAALKGFQHDFMPIYQWKDLPMAGRSGSVAQHQAPKAWLPNLHNLTRAEFAALRRIYDATVRQYYEFPPVWDGPNRVGLSEAEWRRVTKAPLLAAAAAAAFAAKHRLKADAEAKKYTHIVYAEVGVR